MAKAMQNRCGWQKPDLSEVVAYVSNICGVALNGEKLDILPLLKSKLDSLLPESKTATGKGVKDSPISVSQNITEYIH